MADNAQSLAELKRTLLSLVCSNPARMDVNCLKRDFANTEREGRIPIHKYGHKDLITFLNTECRDIFQFEGNKYNPNLIPIVTKEIKQLNELVVKQKTALGKSHLQKRSKGIISSNNSPMYNKNRNDFHNGATTPFRQSNYSNWQNNSVAPRFQDKATPRPAIVTTPPAPMVTTASSYRVNAKVVDNLTKLMAERPDGLWSHELLSSYEAKYKIDLPLSRLGYNSVIMMCKDLPQVFKVVRPDPLGDWRLFSCGVVIPEQYQEESAPKPKPRRRDDEADCRPTDCEVEIFGIAALPGFGFDPSLYPKDCIPFGACIPPSLKLRPRIRVLVAEVRDPSHFWFQVSSPECSEALVSLMDDMDDLYTQEGTSLEMVRAAARVGQLCAVPYCSRYHRAVVIKNISFNTVKVRYIDYGTVADVEASSLRMLHTKFGGLALQAYRGRMAGVAPLSVGRWSAGARTRFLEMVSEKELQAEIHHTDEENKVYELRLFEWKGTAREYLSDQLVAEGLAQSEDDSPTKPHFLPTFEDLENGVVDEDPKSEPNTDAPENSWEVKIPEQPNEAEFSSDSEGSSRNTETANENLIETVSLRGRSHDVPFQDLTLEMERRGNNIVFVTAPYNPPYMAPMNPHYNQPPPPYGYIPHPPEYESVFRLAHSTPPVYYNYLPQYGRSDGFFYPQAPYCNPPPLMSMVTRPPAPYARSPIPNTPVRPPQHYNRPKLTPPTMQTPILNTFTNSLKTPKCQPRCTNINNLISIPLQELDIKKDLDIVEPESIVMGNKVKTLTEDKNYDNVSLHIENKMKCTVDEDEEQEYFMASSSEKSFTSTGDNLYNILNLIEIGEIRGKSVEIWMYKESPHVLLQQFASAVMKPDDVLHLLEDVKDRYNRSCSKGREYRIIQDDIFSTKFAKSIKKCGLSPFRQGEEIMIMANENLDWDQDYLIFVPVVQLLDDLCCNRENLKVDVGELMSFIIAIVKKHTIKYDNSDEESNEDSDVDSDGSDN